MGLISVADLQPGMRLASSVMDGNGRLLLGQGAEITAKHVSIFETYGIIEVDVEGASKEAFQSAALEDIGEEYVKKADAELQSRFRYTKLENEVVREVYRIALLRKAQQIKQLDSKDGTPKKPQVMMGNRAVWEVDQDNEKIKPSQLLTDEVQLPSLPAIFTQLTEAIEDPNSSAQKISWVISKDTALSTKLLKLVNSPFYGFESKIDTLSRAVAVAGVKQLCELAAGISVIKAFKDIPAHLIDMTSFWKHSIACGVCARILADRARIKNSERLFIAGLLHDVGRLILFHFIPNHSHRILLDAKMKKKGLRDVELEILNFDHALIGSRALKNWKFPPALVNAVAYHHDPRNAFDMAEAGIIQTADMIVNALEYGSSGEEFVPPISPGVWSYLQFSLGIIDPSVRQMDNQLEEVLRLLCSDES